MGDRAAAVQMYVQAVEAQKNRKPGQPLVQDLSYQLVSSAAMADPTMALAFYEIGNANADNSWRTAAVAAYRRMIELPDGGLPGDSTPDWRSKAMVNLAHNLHHIGRNTEAKKVVLEALERDAKLSNGWLTLSLIQNVEGLLPEAVASAREAMKLEKTPAIELGLAFALLHSGQYAEGLKHFEARFEYVLRQFLSYPYPQWKGEPGKSVFLVADQGMGDTLSFSRFVPQIIERSKFVHMRIQPELVRLFRVLFQRYSNISIEPIPCAFPPAECWTTFMCLPVALGLTTEEIRTAPNLPCPQFNIGSSWKSSDRKLHIGVAWTGSTANWINHWRSFPIEQLLDLYECPDVQLYGLQIGDRAQDIHNIGAATLIRDMNPFCRDVADTLAILNELDLVITCESALGHIAGFVGKECWVPYSYSGGDFRLGRDEKGSLWYPNHRVFKQGPDNAWPPVFRRIIDALKDRQSNTMREAAE